MNRCVLEATRPVPPEVEECWVGVWEVEYVVDMVKDVVKDIVSPLANHRRPAEPTTTKNGPQEARISIYP